MTRTEATIQLHPANITLIRMKPWTIHTCLTDPDESLQNYSAGYKKHGMTFNCNELNIGIVRQMLCAKNEWLTCPAYV